MQLDELVRFDIELNRNLVMVNTKLTRQILDGYVRAPITSFVVFAASISSQLNLVFAIRETVSKMLLSNQYQPI